jgi:hypothetical protein
VYKGRRRIGERTEIKRGREKKEQHKEKKKKLLLAGI